VQSEDPGLQLEDRRSQFAVRQSLRAVLRELFGDLTQQAAVLPLLSACFSLQFKVLREEPEDRVRWLAVTERFPEDLSLRDEVLREQDKVLSKQDEDRTQFAAVLEQLPEDRGVLPAEPGNHRKDGRGLVEVMTRRLASSRAARRSGSSSPRPS
jgi:hypothetical protein